MNNLRKGQSSSKRRTFERLESRVMLAADVVAFNDHVAGPSTGDFVTSYSANGITQGNLRNSVTNQQISAVLSTSESGVDYENASGVPAFATDSYSVFSGAVDFGGGNGESLALSGSDTYTHSFTSLSGVSSYSFTGTAIRGRADYTDRWTLVTLVGADSFAANHSDGVGIVTDGLSANQVAIWTGANHESDQGFVVSWAEIDPGTDGAFSVVSQQYTGATPGVGSGTANGSKGYGLSALQLIEHVPSFGVESADPAAGATLLATPTEYTVNFDAEVDAATLQAADLMINGQAATSVTLVDSDTARFTLPTLDGEGAYSVAIPDGALASVNGNGIAAFESSFIVLDGIGGVVINEIHYDSGSDALPWEFVELLNAGPSQVDLSGWKLEDAIDYTFPQGTTIDPGEYLVVAQHSEQFMHRYGFTPLGVYSGGLSSRGETLELVNASGQRQDGVDYNNGFPWPTIGDVDGHSIQLINPSLTNDSGGAWRSSDATPGLANAPFAANAAPLMRKVEHGPEAPLPGEDVTITAKVTDPHGVALVVLEYQLVNPGDYIEIDDPRYQTEWVSMAMRDDGLAGDEVAGDDTYTVVLPASLQTHRRLVRYRLTATDSLGASVTAPYEDDGQPNFVYFVYGETPSWTGSAQPGVEPDVTYSGDLLDSVSTYHLITTQQDHVNSQYLPGATDGKYEGSDYLWQGTLVYNGVVYDHISYRARGGVWRYAMGKNMWKFDLNTGHEFQALDNYGNEYDTGWRKLNLSSIIQQGNIGGRGEQGLFESAAFKLFDLAGVPSSNTNYVSFRIIESADENGTDQYSSDYQGLYLAVEQVDGRYLDARDMADGNLYKMEEGTGVDDIGGELKNQGDYPQVSDSSDLIDFKNAYASGNPSASWWENNVNLDSYYSYRAVSLSIHHYDQWNGKNYYFYNNPETGLWEILPWDIDLSWSLEGSITDAWSDDILDYSQFERDYQNNMRELRDLVLNSEQTGVVIDELASFIYASGEASIVDADRAMWDYNPIMSSSYVNGSKAGTGGYYAGSSRVPETESFAGMIAYMKDYFDGQTDWIDSNVLDNDNQVPDKPTISYTGEPGYGAGSLSFSTSDFTDPNGDSFAAMEWRVGEVSNPNTPLHDPTQAWRYEIDALWESGELDTYNSSIDLGIVGVQAGHTYRARVRMQDADGHWSHWSDAHEFIAGAGPIPELAISELHYHPNAPHLADENDLEFIEVMNIGSFSADLTGVQLTDFSSTPYVFEAGTNLAAGERIVVPRNADAFYEQYGDSMNVVDNDYSGNLSNGGELVSLLASGGEVIESLEYDDKSPWPEAADGDGPSLERINPHGDATDPANWAASSSPGGTPGEAPTIVEPLPGDYDGSGLVDGDDYTLWRQTYGSTSDLRADGNGDLRVDAADYSVWRDYLGASTASQSGPVQAASKAALSADEPAEAVGPRETDRLWNPVVKLVLLSEQRSLVNEQPLPPSMAERDEALLLLAANRFDHEIKLDAIFEEEDGRSRGDESGEQTDSTRWNEAHGETVKRRLLSPQMDRLQTASSS